MAFANSPNRSNASITVSSQASDQPGAARRAAPMQSFNDLAAMRISLARKVRAESIAALMSPTDSNRSDTGDDPTLIRWVPVVVPLLALLPILAAYFIGWGVLAGTH